MSNALTAADQTALATVSQSAILAKLRGVGKVSHRTLSLGAYVGQNTGCDDGLDQMIDDLLAVNLEKLIATGHVEQTGKRIDPRFALAAWCA